MFLYNPSLENFVDGVEFGPQSPCVWVVYPAGCAGDLLSSIINFHYTETGARYRGITSKGQVIFRPSDMKYTNHYKNPTINQQFFYDINAALGNINLNVSKMDQFIFSNHWHDASRLQTVLSTFPNCKIIRLLPRTTFEHSVITWLSQFKNTHPGNQEFVPVQVDTEIDYRSTISDSRILTVYFGDLIHKVKFKLLYQSITQHLNLPGPMIDYSFIQFWIDNQHPTIQDHIKRLATI